MKMMKHRDQRIAMKMIWKAEKQIQIIPNFTPKILPDAEIA